MRKINENLIVFGQHDENTLAQIQRALGIGGEYAVLLADGHLGMMHPIGGVIAYKNLISLAGVGVDIGCGCLAIKTDANHLNIQTNIGMIMDYVSTKIAFGMGRSNNEKVDHELFDDELWKEQPFKDLKNLAREQLGTVGGGNHFVNIFLDEENYVWVGVHFGSRGLGHKTATYFLNQAGGKDAMEAPPTVVKDSEYLGQAYLAGMHLAGRYAYAGREYVARYVVKKILGANILEEIHNHHNFAWREKHFGESFWVVRKGATPAFPGQRGFVGGSMGDNSVILEGVDSEISKAALYSTVHGAGRVMSRNQAKGKFVRDEATGKKIRTQGLVRHDEMMKWLKDKGVTLRGGDLDEAPQAYRRLPEVLEAHAGTIKILHTLRPIGVVMAGKDVKDLYKD